jgi:competence protein ComEA
MPLNPLQQRTAPATGPTPTFTRSPVMFRQLIALAAAAFFALNAFAAVDVNKASQAELETVKGIGPGLSAKILKARETGSFKDWGDLVDRVGGVGPGNAARFSQAGLTVGGSAYERQAPAAKEGKAAKTAKAPKAEKAAKEEGQPAKPRKGSKATEAQPV